MAADGLFLRSSVHLLIGRVFCLLSREEVFLLLVHQFGVHGFVRQKPPDSFELLFAVAPVGRLSLDHHLRKLNRSIRCPGVGLSGPDVSLHLLDLRGGVPHVCLVAIDQFLVLRDANPGEHIAGVHAAADVHGLHGEVAGNLGVEICVIERFVGSGLHAHALQAARLRLHDFHRDGRITLLLFGRVSFLVMIRLGANVSEPPGGTESHENHTEQCDAGQVNGWARRCHRLFLFNDADSRYALTSMQTMCQPGSLVKQRCKYLQLLHF